MDKIAKQLNGCDFVKLYVKYETHIRGFILCMVPHWSDVDDIMQETIAVLWSKYQDKVSHEEDFLRLAYRVARFEVYHHLRQKSNRMTMLSPDVLESLSEKAISTAQHEDQRQIALQSCIKRLKSRDREILALRYELGSSTRSVAKRLERSMDAVYKAMNRIHEKLLFCIQNKLTQE